MKLKNSAFIVLAASLLAGRAFANGDSPAWKNQIRVLTYNIKHGEGGDGKVNLERTASVINAQSPDIVALQEVDQRTTRSRQIAEATKLGELTKMHVAFGKTMPFGGGAYGIAILSRFPILETKTQPLPRQPKEEPRVVLLTVLKLPDNSKLGFVCTHLVAYPQKSDDGFMQACAINAFCADLHLPLILAGDFNAKPSSEAILAVKKVWTDSTDEKILTEPADHPTEKIDYIFYRPAHRFHVVETKVIDEEVASDHRPVLSVLKITAQK